jgi:uncharacterized protein (TIGR03435 family)
MLTRILAFALSVGVATPLLAQDAPRFEVASVKPSGDQPPTPGTAGLRITDRQARFTYLSLKDYIGMAYGVQVYQIVAPDWIASARFEIIATIPEGQQAKDVTKMMAALLEERFHLKSHREQREFGVYALEASPAFKLQPVPPDAPTGGAFSVTSTSGPTGAVVDLGQGASLTIGNNRIELKKVAMAQLAAILERFVDRPVVDQTKLEGRFNIAIELMPEDFQAAMIRSAVAAGVSLPAAALRLLDTASPAAVPDALKALGLPLQQRRAPLEVVVIDSIDRTSTDN